MANALIEIKNLTKNFGDNPAVIDNLDLTVQDGEFLTLLGPSGCGKTTLLRLIGGFEEASQGDIFLQGKAITKLPPESRPINTVFQSYALFPHLNVYENVAFGLRIQNVPSDEIHKRVLDALRLVNLEGFENRDCNQLSGGQRQRVAIARSLVNRPKLLLLDESLSALDLKLRKQMQVELKQLQKETGITFIFVTHDQEEALSMSDRIVLMNGGKIEQSGTPKQIYEDPISLFAAKFIGETTIFEGVIESHEDGVLGLDLMSQKLLLKGYGEKLESGLLKIGQAVHVIVRPEDLRVERNLQDIEANFQLSGQVEEILYRGTVIDLHIVLDNGQKIIATEFYNEDSDALEYQTGIEVFVSWVPGWEVIIGH